VIGDSFHIAVAQDVGRDAERGHGILYVHVLYQFRIGRSGLHDGAAQRIFELSAVEMAAAVLCNLAGPARDDILMAFSAALGVIGRPQSVGDLLDLFEDESIVVEGMTRPHVAGVDAFERRALLGSAVGLVIEARCGFSRSGLGRHDSGRPDRGRCVARQFALDAAFVREPFTSRLAVVTADRFRHDALALYLSGVDGTYHCRPQADRYARGYADFFHSGLPKCSPSLWRLCCL